MSALRTLMIMPDANCAPSLGHMVHAIDSFKYLEELDFGAASKDETLKVSS